MAWSDQQYPVPQGAPQSMPQSPLQPGVANQGMPIDPGLYSANPLQPAALAPVAGMSPSGPGAYPAPAAPSMPPNPMMQPVAPVAMQAPANGQVSTALPQATAQQGDDDRVDTNDVEWVSRAKRAIAVSRGDPHRQVQLIQHLRSQYLKQRFGRAVHTDEA